MYGAIQAMKKKPKKGKDCKIKRKYLQSFQDARI